MFHKDFREQVKTDFLTPTSEVHSSPAPRLAHHGECMQNMTYSTELKISFRSAHSPFVKDRQRAVTSFDVADFHKDRTKTSLRRVCIAFASGVNVWLVPQL